MAKRRLIENLSPIIQLSAAAGESDDHTLRFGASSRAVPSRAPRPAARTSHTWTLASLSSNLQKLLLDNKTTLCRTPIHTESQYHVLLRWHCFRGPAWRVDASRRQRLLQHVPPGCAPPRRSVGKNVGCRHCVSVRYPDNYIPTHCPVTGAKLTGEWLNNLKIEHLEPSEHAPVKVTVYHDHSGHTPGDEYEYSNSA